MTSSVTETENPARTKTDFDRAARGRWVCGRGVGYFFPNSILLLRLWSSVRFSIRRLVARPQRQVVSQQLHDESGVLI